MEFEVWDCNEVSFRVFLRCETQWVVAGMGFWVGLNYPGVETVLRLTCGGMDHAKIFDDVQAAERAALAVLNARKA